MAPRRRLRLVAAMLAVLTLGSAGPAYAASPGAGRIGLSAARWVEVTFENITGEFLTKFSESIEDGKWNVHPPKVIVGFDTQIWGTESNGFLTGTEASVTYRVWDQDVYIYWNNPYFGGNTYYCVPPRHMICNISGGGGRGARVKFQLKIGG